MKVNDIAAAVEKIAPLGLAQDWDNVGLLVGDENKNIKNILVTIDVTTAVVEEAKKLKTDLILSYHPIIWDGLKTVTTKTETAQPSQTTSAFTAILVIGTVIAIPLLFRFRRN